MDWSRKVGGGIGVTFPSPILRIRTLFQLVRVISSSLGPKAMPFGRKPSDNKIESFPLIGNLSRYSPLNENKVTLRNGPAGSKDTAAMPLWYLAKASATIFISLSRLDRSTSSRKVPPTWKKAHSASFVPRALTMKSRSDSLDQAKF